MRLFTTAVLAWLCSPVSVNAQTESLAATTVWVTEITQTWLYGAAPLVIALIAFAGLWLWRRQRRDPHAEMNTPFAYGTKPMAVGGMVLVVCLGLSFYRVQVDLQSTHDLSLIHI